MLKILIVDDDFLISEQLNCIVQDMGHEVTAVAESGQQSVEIALKKVPDLVLMDIYMPNGMGGIVAAEKIREYVDCAIIFVTGYDDESILQNAKHLSPQGFLQKPFTPGEVKTAIEIGFYKKQLDDQLYQANQDLAARLEERTASLKQELDREQKYLETADVMILVLSPLGDVTKINKKGLTILEDKEEAILGRNWFEDFKAKTVFQKGMDSGRSVLELALLASKESVISIRTGNGRKKLIAIRTGLVMSEDGDVLETIISGEDVTQFQMIAKELMESKLS